MRMLDALGFGALNVDKVYMVNRIAGPGEENFITGYDESCGGSAANTAVAMAKLGLSVGYIGKVSEDREGCLLRKGFQENNVDKGGISVADYGRSGVVMALVDPGGERALYVDPGVNDTLTWRDVDIGYASSTHLLHLTSFVGEKPLKAQVKLLSQMREDVKVSLDPGEIYARRGLEALKPLLERTNVLLLNEVEVDILTGLNPQRGAEELRKSGPETVVVKLGGRGCYATDGHKQTEVKSYKVKAMDTTGAGDAFNAGFLYGLLKGLELKISLHLGCFTASRCITKIGARNGLPTKNDLEHFLK